MKRWSDILYLLSKKHQTRKKASTREAKESALNKLFKTPNKRNKYGAKKTALGFPSKLEEAVYGSLLYLEKAGFIKDIERQSTVHFTSKVRWKVDFKVFDLILNEPVWCEAKGVETQDYIIKKNLWHDLGPGLLRIYKGDAKRVYVDEEIRGKTIGPT